MEWQSKVLFSLLGHGVVRFFYLNVGRTRLSELVSLVGILKIAPNPCELGGDLEATELFSGDLRETDRGEVNENVEQ